LLDGLIGNERFDLADKTAEMLDGFATKMGKPELAHLRGRRKQLTCDMTDAKERSRLVEIIAVLP